MPATISNPSVLLARQDAYDALVSFARRFQNDVAYRRAVAGDLSDVLDVPGANRRIYAQLGGIGGDVIEALYDAFKPDLGAGIFLTRARVMGAGGWLVMGAASGEPLPCYPSENLP